MRAFSALLGFVFTVMLSRSLGPAGLGVYAYAVTFIVIATVPISNGWSTVLLKSASASHYSGDWGETRGAVIRGAQFAFLLVGMVLAFYFTLSWLAPEVLQRFEISPWIVVTLASVFLFDQLSGLRIAILRGLDFPLIAQAPELLVRPLVLVATFFLLAWWLEGEIVLVHAFIALVIAAFSNMVFGYVVMWWKTPAEMNAASPCYSTRNWLASAIPISFSSGLIVLNAHVDILILGLFVDTANIGIYRVGVQVSLVSGLAYTSLNLLASQRFAFYRAAGDLAGAQATATFMSRCALSFSIPILLILVVAGQNIVPLVFGEEFESALGPMIILAVGQCVTAATGMAQPLLLMNGLEKRVMAWTMVSVLANIFLCLIFVPRFGVIGAASATVLAATFWNTALWTVARKRTGVDTSVMGLTTSSQSNTLGKI